MGNEELLCADSTLVIISAQNERCTERNHGNRKFRRWVGVGEASAYGTAVANLDVTDITRRFPQQRPVVSHLGRALKLPLAGHGPDSQFTNVELQVPEFANSVEIHEMRWPDQPEIHQWNQTLTAGQRSRAVAKLG